MIDQSIKKNQNYIEAYEHTGYDPYDTLKSYIPFSKLGKWAPVIAIQLQKRNPVNIRPLLGIKKGMNPKSHGLLLRAYSILYRKTGEIKYLQIAEKLFQWLINNYSPGYSGYCWGYNFDWASPAKYLKAYHPSIVVTSFVAKGIFEYYQVTNNSEIREIVNSVCSYIINDLPITETEHGICFSYTDVKRDCCYNANMLGAEVLAKTYSLTGEKEYYDLAKKAVDFTIAHQHANGRWNYSIELNTGKEREQIDFHQGFVLESLYEYVNYTGDKDPRCINAISKGVEYYRKNQFFHDGRSLWRVPKIYPVDIHNQAQGIITFSILKDYNPEYIAFAHKIADWTVKNMQSEEGYFYYRKNRLFTNKIPYMRWSQAWMLLALSTLVSNNE